MESLLQYLNHDIKSSSYFSFLFLLLPIMQSFQSIFYNPIKALCMQRLIMTIKALIDQILRFQSAIHFACAHSLTTSTRFYNHNCKMQMTIFFRACIHDIYLLSTCKVTQNIRNMQVKRAESLLL